MRKEFMILVRDETGRTFPADYASTRDEADEIAEALRKSFQEGDMDCYVSIWEG